ncbi:MAG: hypothetical protein WCO35_02065 [Candidatus Nomurabacteria bacterium]
MKKIINNNLFKKIIINISVSLSVLLFIFNSFVSAHHVSAQATDNAVQSIDALSNNGNGLIGDCGRTEQGKVTNQVCSPKAAVTLIAKLAQVFVYLIVISLVLILVVSGVGYVYYGDKPEYLIKIKKYIKNGTIALLMIMLVFTALFGLLTVLGFNAQLLDFFKQIFAFNDFGIIPHAMAQEVPVLATNNNHYLNFFSGQTIGSLVLLAIKFLVNYFAAPILTISVVIAGSKFVLAQGNQIKLDEAKKFAKRVIIGIAVAAAAELIIMVLLNTINDVKKSVDVTTPEQVVTANTNPTN